MSTNLLFSTSSSTTTAQRVADAAMMVMVVGLFSGLVGLFVRQAKIVPSAPSFDVPSIMHLQDLFGGRLYVPLELIGAGFDVMNNYELTLYFLIPFSLPILIFNLMARGVLASAFLPTFTLFITRGEQEKGWRLASAMANWLIIASSIVSLLVLIFWPWLVGYIIPSALWPKGIQLPPLWMLLLFVSTVIFSLSGLIMSILNAYQHFLMPAIAPMMYYLGIFFGASVLTSYFALSGLALGMMLGALGLTLVQLPKLRQFGAHYTLTLGWRDPVIWHHLRHVARLLLPSLFGVVLIPSILFANRIIAWRYDSGRLINLYYAEIITLLPTGFLALSVAIVIFPTFSRMAAKNNKAGIGKALVKTLRCLLFVAMPLAVLIVLLCWDIDYVLFGRGAFDATPNVAWVLGFYGLTIIPYFLIEVINRAYFAIQDTLRPVTIAAVAMMLNVMFSLALVSRIGLVALPLANTIAAITQLLLLLWVLAPKVGGIEARVLLSSTVRFAIAAGVMIIALLAIEQLSALIWYPDTTLTLILLLFIMGLPIYFATAWLLGIEEARFMVRIIQPQR